MIHAEGGSSTAMMEKYSVAVQHAFRNMAYMPMAFITAKTGKNVKALFNLAQAMFKQANRRVGTGTLNRVLREAVADHAPPPRENRTPKIFYATQVGTAPPTVVLFVNQPSLFDAPYQRYLLNVFRQRLPFRDIPIKLYLRARSQTDLDAPRSKSLDAEGDEGSRTRSSTKSPATPSVDDSFEDPSLSDRDIDKLLAESGQ